VQDASWYFKRLMRMSPAEVAWRTRSRLRGYADHVAWLIRRPKRAEGHGRGVAFHVNPGAIAPHLAGSPGDDAFSADARQRLIERAQRLLAGRMELFDRPDVDVGPSIDWNFEYRADVPTPLGFAATIDYRDHRITGDCKWVWEVNRHHHLVVLGRAYRVTAEARYAEAVARQLDDWITACPVDTGMNWRSPLELGVRLINWAWAVELVRPSGCFDGPLGRRVATAAYRQVRDIDRKYSRFSSANNHLIGEAAGVFVAGCYFRAMPGADRLRDRAAAMLEREIVAQTWPDGANREQAFGYHLFVMELLTVAGITARNAACDFSDVFWSRLRRMHDFAFAMLQAGEAVNYGDCDDAYVLDLDGLRRDPHAHLAVGAAIFDGPELLTSAQAPTERVYWLLGPSAATRWGAEAGRRPVPLRGRAFPDAGIFLLQRGSIEAGTDVRVFFDCGELGMGSLAAHGHADALSIAVRAYGCDVIVDPGTFDYFTYPQWREYFRSTAAHNTIEVDGVDQSERLGPFMWGRRAQPRCLKWDGDGAVATVEADHDGYVRLADPVRHRRRVRLLAEPDLIELEDTLIARGRHHATMRFHLAPECEHEVTAPGTVEARFATGTLTLSFDPAFEIQVRCGESEPIRGWTSRGYHRREASPTIEASAVFDGTQTWVTRLQLWSPRQQARHPRHAARPVTHVCR